MPIGSLASYQSQTGIIDVPQNAQAIINQLAQYQTQRDHAAITARRAEAACR